MPLQNRVTPFGDVVALPGRGLLMGNRGILVDQNRRIVRRWQGRRWIACRLDMPGRRREVMRPNSYTELFFLDEAAAFAAGHRPCAECRRPDYRHFVSLWIACHGGSGRADDIDQRLHAERLAGKAKRTWRSHLEDLPFGSYIAIDGTAFLVHRDGLFVWTDGGYRGMDARLAPDEIDVLTPPSIVSVLRAGYEAAVHPSASEG